LFLLEVYTHDLALLKGKETATTMNAAQVPLEIYVGDDDALLKK
jgi:hypothetical protein